MQVSYLTQIRLAPTFQQFVPSQVLRSSMVKKVCVIDNVLQETLVLRNIILKDTLQIDMNAIAAKKQAGPAFQVPRGGQLVACSADQL